MELKVTSGSVVFSNDNYSSAKFWLESPVVAKYFQEKLWLFWTGEKGNMESAVARVDEHGNLAQWAQLKVVLPGVEVSKGWAKITVCFVPKDYL